MVFSSPFVFGVLFQCLQGLIWIVLGTLFLDKEIKRAIFSIGNFKSLRENSFQSPFFYLSQWDTMGALLM